MTDVSAAKGTPPTPQVSPVAAWGSVSILWIFSILSTIDRQIISLMVDDVKVALHLSDTQIGLLQGFAFSLFYCLAAIPIGWAADRFSRRAIIYVGISLWSLSAAACGLARGFSQLFAARIGVGVGEASLAPAAVSLIGDIFPRDKVGGAMGVYASGSYLGSGVSLIVSGAVVTAFTSRPFIDFPGVGKVASWQAVFFVIGLPGLLLALLTFLLADPRAGAPRAEVVSDRGQVGRYLARNWLLVVLTFGGASSAALTFYAVGAWTPAFLARTFGLSPAHIGFAWGLTVAAAGGAGAILGGMLIDRVYRRGVADSCLVVPALAALAAWPLMVVGYQLPSPSLVLASLGVGTALLGIVAVGTYATLQQMATPALRGRLMAIMGLSTVALGGSFGPVFVGFLTDRVYHNEKMVGVSLSIVMSVALALVVILLLGARGPLRRLTHG